MFPCCGIIVFSKDRKSTVLVETERGHLSFPKGKREKGETDLETAYRELYEETGITKDMIDIFDDYFDEMSPKGFPSVRYFVGILNCEYENFKFNEKELCIVRWYPTFVITSLKDSKLRDTRKNVFEVILNHIEKLV